MVTRLEYIKQKGIQSLRSEGVLTVSKKSIKYLYRQTKLAHRMWGKQQCVKDILFINGCDIDHPARYRVYHQLEQLEFNGMSADMVWYGDINVDMVKYYRGFILFRCPITEVLKAFIAQGKYHNKTFFYDIDDLVFDEKYVSSIKYLKQMSEKDLPVYMDGVRRYKEAMQLCDYGITTTKTLRREMEVLLPEVYINRNVASEEMCYFSNLALPSKNQRDVEKIRIGYLSGSITHNPDFELIKPALKKILKAYPHVQLVVGGFIELPEDLKEFTHQIEIQPFVDWKKLPEIIAQLDINLSPLEDTLFNRAKSENKWTEAALLKVPTVASNIGAFQEVLEDQVNCVLSDNTAEAWYTKLKNLCEDKEQRERIGINAYRKVLAQHTTVHTGRHVTDFITSKLSTTIGFVIPGTVVRGGINVIVKHGTVLREHGYDVHFLSQDTDSHNIITSQGEINVTSNKQINSLAHFDIMVGTLWDTVEFLQSYATCSRKCYLVQNFETDFYPFSDQRRKSANATYSLNNIEYLTISKWCQKWLLENYNQHAKYCPNGIDLQQFHWVEKDFSGKVRILIEGNSTDEYKNTDESFKIVKELDDSKFEIWYLSYDNKPKSWYRIDKFFHQVPYSEVAEIFQQSHILLKSSKVESFSYPPVEMMATGGVAVIAANGGNAAYAEHRKNCLVYDVGDVDIARNYIYELTRNEKLRNQLILEGLKTARQLDWKSIEKEIINLYAA